MPQEGNRHAPITGILIHEQRHQPTALQMTQYPGSAVLHGNSFNSQALVQGLNVPIEWSVSLCFDNIQQAIAPGEGGTTEFKIADVSRGNDGTTAQGKSLVQLIPTWMNTNSLNLVLRITAKDFSHGQSKVMVNEICKVIKILTGFMGINSGQLCCDHRTPNAQDPAGK